MRPVVFLSLLMSLQACSKGEPLSLAIRTDAPALQSVHSTLYSNIREPRRLIIRDAETWARAWTEMISVGDPRTPPFVDFAEEDVIVAALGERRAGGYSIAITGVHADPNGAQVIVATTVPGPGCDGAEIVTTPLEAVRVTKLAGNVRFDERSNVRSCN